MLSFGLCSTSGCAEGPGPLASASASFLAASLAWSSLAWRVFRCLAPSRCCTYCIAPPNSSPHSLQINFLSDRCKDRERADVLTACCGTLPHSASITRADVYNMGKVFPHFQFVAGAMREIVPKSFNVLAGLDTCGYHGHVCVDKAARS